MKICSIRGCNLASLAGDFVVDFEQAPLSTTGLFAITGATGSGKSTLLDAMFLALFDKTPRLCVSGGPAIGLESDDEKQRLGANDVRSLLRKGAGDGFAEVKFIGRDERPYRARWTVRRARNKPDGAFQSQEVTLLDLEKDERLGEGKKDTLEKIEQRLGLNFGQFSRSVVLAQGEFAAFLRAKEDERAALLEQMTGSELYSDVSIRAFNRAKTEEESLERLRNERTANPPLAEESRLALNEQVEHLVEEQESNRGRLDAATKAVAWFDVLATLKQGETEARHSLELAAKSVSDAAPRKEALNRARTANEVRAQHDAWTQAGTRAKDAAQAVAPAMKALERSTAALDAAKAEQVSALESRKQAEQALDAAQEPLKAARVLDTQIAAKQKEHAALTNAAAQATRNVEQAETIRAAAVKENVALEKKRKSIEAELERLAPYEALVASWAATRAILGTAKSKLSGRGLDSPSTDLSSAEAVAEAGRCLTAARDAEADAKHADADAKTAREAVDREAMDRDARNLDARGQTLGTLASIQDDWRAASNKLEAARAETTKRKEAAANFLARAETARQEQTAARAKLESTELLEREFKTAAGLSAQRAELRDGHPCPLCGATEHPAAQESPVIEARLEELTTEVARLKASGDRHGADRNTHQIAANKATSEADLHARLADEACVTIGKLESKWTIEAATIDVATPSVNAQDLVTEWLSQQDENLRKGRTQLAERKAALAALETAARSASKALDGARARCEIADRSFQVEEALESVSASLERISAWRRSFLANAETFLSRVDADVKTRTKTDLEHGRLATQEQQGLDRQRSAENDADRLRGDLRQHTEKVSACSNELATLKTERAGFLGGRDANEVEESLKSAVTSTRRACERADDAVRLRDAERNESEKGLQRASQEAALRKEAVEQSHATLDAAVATRNLTIAELPPLLAITVDALRKEEALLKKLDDAQRDAALRLEDRQQKRDAHETSEKPDQAEDVARAERDSLTAKRDAQQTRLGGLKLEQQQDDERRTKDARIAVAIAQQETRATTWSRLRDLIGSADGKKFRKFAQSLTFEALLEQTNVHLTDLARRYELMRVPGHDLELQLIDHDLADEVRSVASLSGGESFLVSLALALGLSSLGAGAVQLQSLFIDEGFGTLDPETLDVALDVLDALQASGRKVGIISHAHGLEARLAAHVRVTRTGSGRSRVEVGH